MQNYFLYYFPISTKCKKSIPLGYMPVLINCISFLNKSYKFNYDEEYGNFLSCIKYVICYSKLIPIEYKDFLNFQDSVAIIVILL